MNKALEWIRRKKAEGYVPRFKVGDVIMVKSGEFTLLAKIEGVDKAENLPAHVKTAIDYAGEYRMRYLVNNYRARATLEGKYAVARKDIKAIDAKYNICENPEMFKVLYSGESQ